MQKKKGERLKNWGTCAGDISKLDGLKKNLETALSQGEGKKKKMGSGGSKFVEKLKSGETIGAKKRYAV